MCYGRRALAKPRTTLLSIHPEHPEPHRIGQAVAHLEAGRVIVYPTDTLYGLAADIENRTAIERLYSLRRLDPNKPLSLICRDLSQVAHYAIMSDECYRFMKRALPGPYTFILKATRVTDNDGLADRGHDIAFTPPMVSWILGVGVDVIEVESPLDGHHTFRREDGERDTFDIIAMPLSADDRHIDHVLCHVKRR